MYLIKVFQLFKLLVSSSGQPAVIGAHSEPFAALAQLIMHQCVPITVCAQLRPEPLSGTS